MKHDVVIQQLHLQLERIRNPRRHRAARTRWARSEPALAGLSIDNIIERCSDNSPAQNPVVSSLIALHQRGDDDATTVLLNVAIPVVRGVARHALRSSSGACSPATLSANYWAAVGHVLATINPLPPTGDDGHPKVFLADIAAKVFASRKQLDASERRRYRFNRRHDHDRVLALTDDLIDEEHRRRHNLDRHAVEDAALDRIELDRIADVVRDRLIDPDRWRHLVDHRLGPRGASTSTQRVAAHRTAATLSALVDHVAA